MVGSLVFLLIAVVVVFLVGYVAKFIVDGYFPEPLRTPALVIIGVILLVILLIALANFYGVPLTR